MRAVERTPWADRRTSRHDEMCAAVLRHKQRLFPDFPGEVVATVEADLGGCYADLLAKTVAPEEEQFGALVEVKTNAENASAGDTIRQLKFYMQKLRPVRMTLVVENDGLTPDALEMFLNEQIDVLPIWYFTAPFRADAMGDVRGVLMDWQSGKVDDSGVITMANAMEAESIIDAMRASGVRIPSGAYETALGASRGPTSSSGSKTDRGHL